MRDDPITSGDAGVLPLFNYQGASRTVMVVEHVYRTTLTGLFLLRCIEELVLESGLYGTLWKTPFKHISRYVIDHSLINHTCGSNASNDIHLSVVHGEIRPQCEGDISLMSIAIGKFTDSKDPRSIHRVKS